jgi:primosomal protein N' (replication factor Y) (superfamily II helicase)
MSQYYNTSLRQVLKSLLPASIRNNVSHKEQFFVTRRLSQEKTRAECSALREKHPAQAKVLDVLLAAPKGLLLTELLEKAGVSPSPVEGLAKRDVIQVERVRIDRSPLIGEEYLKTEPKKLNGAQLEAYTKITQALLEKKFETHLIHGVTGSGKTEIYLQAIEFALKEGFSSVMLVPEISLTGQTVERFRARFDEKIAILHHRLSQGERFDEWHRIRRGEAKIVIGARSALFCPAQNLRLIIVDEEHDGAYKQSEESPCYHARDVAVMRGKLNQAVVVLGTATPSLESYYNTQIGKYHLTTLPTRATDSTLPKVHIVDMKKEYAKAGGFTSFSELLIEKIKKRLSLGEQTILFLNRRGYHTTLQCKGCGSIFSCPCCDLALTFHRGANILACHLCDHRQTPPPTTCPQCKHGEALKYSGVGTEQVERAIHALFPEARTLRVDGDTTRHKGSHEKLFRIFQTQKADILIGTQMIAKGLHFPAVTLVAVLNGDGGLHIPDFRASEKVFQLITQVAGRAGRGELAGEVIIQTQMPENTTIHHAASQGFEAFYHSEIESRKLFFFPPFTHLVKLTFSGKEMALTQEKAKIFREGLLPLLGKNALVHPVVPSGYPKIKDFFRFQCLIRSKSVSTINQAIQHLLLTHPLPRKLRLHIDVDPLSTF